MAQYPPPHHLQHHEPRKSKHWGAILLGILGIILLLGIITYFILIPLAKVKANVGSILEESPNQRSIFVCDQDSYNCGDFNTQTEAQEVFDACGPEDIHGLDNDGDGIVCEGLG